MVDTPPSPTTLTRTRILILVFMALAAVLIVGAISGGVANYTELRQARDAALSSSEAAK